jgi:hypothetical protein
LAFRGRKGADAVLLASLAAGQTIALAAAAAGVSERTVHRRLADAAFCSRLDRLRGAMIDRALGQLADAMADAAGVLRKLLKAKNDNVKLGACRSLLELGSKLRDAVELERRLAELERRFAKITTGGKGRADP